MATPTMTPTGATAPKGSRGKAPIHWSEGVWKALDHPVTEEMMRTIVAAKFMPQVQVDTKQTTAPSDIVIVSQATAAGFSQLDATAGVPFDPAFSVNESQNNRVQEYWTTFKFSSNPGTAIGSPICAANSLSAVATSFSVLQRLDQYEPYALALHTIPYADFHQALKSTLIEPVEPISHLIKAGIYGTGTISRFVAVNQALATQQPLMTGLPLQTSGTSISFPPVGSAAGLRQPAITSIRSLPSSSKTPPTSAIRNTRLDVYADEHAESTFKGIAQPNRVRVLIGAIPRNPPTGE